MIRIARWLPLLVIAPTLGAQSALPPIGIAVSDSARAWCAAFRADASVGALAPGTPVTIVIHDTAFVPSMSALIRAQRGEQCPAAFPQPRWFDYVAYDLELIDAAAGEDLYAPVALVVAGSAAWARAADGLAHADLDDDGRPEELRRCLAGEGEHLTVWSRPRDAAAIRLWHEYYDWGAEVDPSCAPGEDGGL